MARPQQVLRRGCRRVITRTGEVTDALTSLPRALVELVRNSGYRISTGFVGTPLLCDALTSAGEHEAAFRLLTQRACPSWLYPVTMGATTVWERWDSLLPDGSVNPGEMTSFNHYALGAVADWLHRTVGGLAPAAPGYRRLNVSPRPGGGQLWIKDESSRLGLPSFKLLGASWTIYRAILAHLATEFPSWKTIDDLRRAVEPFCPLTLISATDGNHGRAVARMAALLGLVAHIFVPAGMSPARIQAIESEGAAVTIVDGTYDDAVARSAQEASERSVVVSDTSWPGYRTSREKAHGFMHFNKLIG